MSAVAVKAEQSNWNVRLAEVQAWQHTGIDDERASQDLLGCAQCHLKSDRPLCPRVLWTLW